MACGRFPDAPSQIHTLTLELTTEAEVTPRTPELLITVAGDSSGDNGTATQACQEVSHLKAHWPFHRIL